MSESIKTLTGGGIYSINSRYNASSYTLDAFIQKLDKTLGFIKQTLAVSLVCSFAYTKRTNC